jgi:hypothetical protein
MTMNRLNGWVVLAAILTAGCASAPEQTIENEGATAALSAVQGTQAAAAATAALSAAQGAQATGTAAPTAPVAELDANSLDPGSVVRCREMLKPGSNVVVRQCMSRDDWKRYERMLELQAQQMLRTMQGSAFR